MTEPFTFIRACRFVHLERSYGWGRFFPDTQGNTGFLGIGLGNTVTSVTNDGDENMYVPTTGVKTFRKGTFNTT